MTNKLPESSIDKLRRAKATLDEEYTRKLSQTDVDLRVIDVLILGALDDIVDALLEANEDGES